MTDPATAPIPRPIRFGADEIPPGYAHHLAPADDGWVPPEEPADADEQDELTQTEAFLLWVGQRLRRLEGSRKDLSWCPQWWEHPEVLDRLLALWRAHAEAETALDNRAMSSWWVDHWDRHATTLFADQGPFRGCTPEEHQKYAAAAKPAIDLYLPPSGWALPDATN